MIPDCTPSTTESRRQLARTFLELANTEYQRHKHHRGYYARIARDHGLTHQEIADAYGITEAAVRGLITRAGK
jgi:DNA-binding transcriptional regulator LsrR (DeoR family)